MVCISGIRLKMVWHLLINWLIELRRVGLHLWHVDGVILRILHRKGSICLAQILNLIKREVTKILAPNFFHRVIVLVLRVEIETKK